MRYEMEGARAELIDICLDTIQDVRDKNSDWHVIALARDCTSRLESFTRKVEDCEFRHLLHTYKHWIAKDGRRDPDEIVILEVNYSSNFPWVVYVKEGMSNEYSGGCALKHIREHYFPNRHHADTEKPMIVLQCCGD
jgi:hypothetical protein